nr:hypothetical protein Q903MT_gene6204 [Picea sitchensis]
MFTPNLPHLFLPRRALMDRYDNFISSRVMWALDQSNAGVSSNHPWVFVSYSIPCGIKAGIYQYKSPGKRSDQCLKAISCGPSWALM